MTDKATASDPARRLPGSRRRDPQPAAVSEARVRIPPEVRERLDEVARERGVSRPDFVRAALERALAAERPAAVAGDGNTELLLNGAVRPPDGPPEIPAPYVARSPLPAPPATDEEAPADVAAADSPASAPASILGLSAEGPSAPVNGTPAAASAPAAAPEPVGEDVLPESESDSPLPAALPDPASVPAPRSSAGPDTRVESSLLLSRAGVFALLSLATVAFVALALFAFTSRYQVHAPSFGVSLAGAYDVLDRWTGDVWFCDAARRGRDTPRCVRFAGIGSP